MRGYSVMTAVTALATRSFICFAKTIYIFVSYCKPGGSVFRPIVQLQRQQRPARGDRLWDCGIPRAVSLRQGRAARVTGSHRYASTFPDQSAGTTFCLSVPLWLILLVPRKPGRSGFAAFSTPPLP